VVFVRRKVVDGNEYYQIVHNYRENGKHRQKFIHYLGKHPTLSAAIDAERQLESRCRVGASKLSVYSDLPPSSQSWAARNRLLNSLWELCRDDKRARYEWYAQGFEALAKEHRSKLNRLLKLRKEYPYLS